MFLMRIDLSNLNLLPASAFDKLGTTYGGWHIPKNIQLNKNSVCYLAGAGEDISFDCELAKKFGCEIHIFDPTPRAIEHFNNLHKEIIRGGKLCINSNESEYYDIDIKTFQLMAFHEIGIAGKDCELKFFYPKDQNHVSCSAQNIQNTEEFFIAKCFCLQTIMNNLGHTKIDLVKLDIEGAEYEVIQNIVDSAVLPSILAVEFHRLHDDHNMEKDIFNIIKLLYKNDMKIVFVDGFDATFVKKTFMPE